MIWKAMSEWNMLISPLGPVHEAFTIRVQSPGTSLSHEHASKKSFKVWLNVCWKYQTSTSILGVSGMDLNVVLCSHSYVFRGKINLENSFMFDTRWILALHALQLNLWAAVHDCLLHAFVFFADVPAPSQEPAKSKTLCEVIPQPPFFHREYNS